MLFLLVTPPSSLQPTPQSKIMISPLSRNISMVCVEEIVKSVLKRLFLQDALLKHSDKVCQLDKTSLSSLQT